MWWHFEDGEAHLLVEVHVLGVHWRVGDGVACVLVGAHVLVVEWHIGSAVEHVLVGANVLEAGGRVIHVGALQGKSYLLQKQLLIQPDF